MQQRDLNIAFSIDDTYAFGAAVTARSIWLNLCDKSTRLTFFVLDAGLSQSGRSYISDALHIFGDVRLCDVPDRLILSEGNGWWTSATLGRLHLERIIPEDVRKVVYLDADTLVLEDLTRLLDSELDGNGLGAVTNEMSPSRAFTIEGGVLKSSVLGAKAPGYFNGGVLLIDMQVWRAIGVAERAMQLWRTFGPEFAVVDQDVLNLLFAGKWTSLPPRWNKFVEHSRHGKYGKSRLRYLTRPEGIVHFIGQAKPWQDAFPRNSLHALYSKYSLASPIFSGCRTS